MKARVFVGAALVAIFAIISVKAVGAEPTDAGSPPAFPHRLPHHGQVDAGTEPDDAGTPPDDAGSIQEPDAGTAQPPEADAGPVEEIDAGTEPTPSPEPPSAHASSEVQPLKVVRPECKFTDARGHATPIFCGDEFPVGGAVSVGKDAPRWKYKIDSKNGTVTFFPPGHKGFEVPLAAGQVGTNGMNGRDGKSVVWQSFVDPGTQAHCAHVSKEGSSEEPLTICSKPGTGFTSQQVKNAFAANGVNINARELDEFERQVKAAFEEVGTKLAQQDIKIAESDRKADYAVATANEAKEIAKQATPSVVGLGIEGTYALRYRGFLGTVSYDSYLTKYGDFLVKGGFGGGDAFGYGGEFLVTGSANFLIAKYLLVGAEVVVVTGIQNPLAPALFELGPVAGFNIPLGNHNSIRAVVAVCSSWSVRPMQADFAGSLSWEYRFASHH